MHFVADVMELVDSAVPSGTVFVLPESGSGEDG